MNMSPADPETAEALEALARGALVRGDVAEAIALLQRGTATHPDHADLQCGLGIACLRADRADEAAQALRACLAQDPQHVVARLFLGHALERLGEPDDALAAYFGAINRAQAAGQWREASAIPEGLRELVQHAMGIVIRGRRELFYRVLEPLRPRYGAGALRRVERGLAMYLLDEAPRYADPRQRPTFFYLPDLPAQAFLPRERFPWLAELEARTPAVRAELRALLEGGARFEPFHKSDPGSYLKGTRGAAAWDTFFFYRDGRRVEDNCARCPATAAALELAPLVRIDDHAPECLFSVLQPGTHILPHRGVTNTRLVAHLPLVVPPDCALTVGGEAYAWQEGHGVVFDDTYEHEAWNRSDRARAVLILDIWHPDLDDAERAAIAALVHAIGRFNADSGLDRPRA